ncbi:MAG: hypothetical protein Q9211_007078 [Gyalolechia sp. 1 TL-2023]
MKTWVERHAEAKGTGRQRTARETNHVLTTWRKVIACQEIALRIRRACLSASSPRRLDLLRTSEWIVSKSLSGAVSSAGTTESRQNRYTAVLRRLRLREQSHRTRASRVACSRSLGQLDPYGGSDPVQLVLEAGDPHPVVFGDDHRREERDQGLAPLVSALGSQSPDARHGEYWPAAGPECPAVLGWRILHHLFDPGHRLHPPAGSQAAGDGLGSEKDLPVVVHQRVDGPSGGVRVLLEPPTGLEHRPVENVMHPVIAVGADHGVKMKGHGGIRFLLEVWGTGWGISPIGEPLQRTEDTDSRAYGMWARAYCRTWSASAEDQNRWVPILVPWGTYLLEIQ